MRRWPFAQHRSKLFSVKSRQEDFRIKATAFHEAGHVAVAFHFGLPRESNKLVLRARRVIATFAGELLQRQAIAGIDAARLFEAHEWTSFGA